MPTVKKPIVSACKHCRGHLGRGLLVAEVGADEHERHADAEPQEAQREQRAEGHRPAGLLAPHLRTCTSL